MLAYWAGRSKEICLGSIKNCMDAIEFEKKKVAMTIIKGDGEDKEKS